MKQYTSSATLTDKGLYLHQSIDLTSHAEMGPIFNQNKELHPPSWKIVSFVSNDYLQLELQKFSWMLFAILFIAGTLAAIGITLFSKVLTQQITTENKLQKLAHYDYLTGLMNRALFISLLEKEFKRSHRNSEQAALLYLDLDNFKPINDELGHEFGDKALKEVANRLGQSIRNYDSAARLGGDEFAILMPNSGSKQDAIELAERIIKTLSAPFELADQQLFINVSIGIALLPSHYLKAKEAIKAADEAMYKAKQQGGKTYQIAVSLTPPPSNTIASQLG